MSRRSDRLREQEQIEREWQSDQADIRSHERHLPVPPDDSPDYCPANLRDGHRHSFYRARDGKLRCYWCTHVRS